jgi:hypothetical protein
VWDAVNPPDVLLRRGDSIAIAFGMGDPLSYPAPAGQAQAPADILATGNVGVNPTAAPAWKCYYSPSMLLQAAEPVCDSRGDVIRYNIAGSGNSHVFLLPDEKAWFETYMRYLFYGDSNIESILASAWNAALWGPL